MRFMQDESGQGLVEYVLVIAMVAIGLIAIMLFFRNAIGNEFKTNANVVDYSRTAPGFPIGS